MKTRNTVLLIVILLLFGFSLWSIIPLESTRFGREGLSLGLDLKGGSHLVYRADLSKKDPEQTDDDAMRGVIDKIERRVNIYGVTEPIIQRMGNDQILVQLPGITDVEEALKLIGKTAELDFRELPPGEQAATSPEGEKEIQWVKATATGSDGTEKVLTGKYLKDARVDLQQQTNEPQVDIVWNDEGALLFEQITERNVGKPLAIFLDDVYITAPRVKDVIKDSGVITGLTLEEARLLAIQLQSGALDVPLEIIQEQDVDATLGSLGQLCGPV